MEKELKYLGKALQHPEAPFVAILGGAKVSDKIGVIQNLMTKVNALIIGGGMAYTFLKAQGQEIGKSLLEADKVDLAKKLLAEAKKRNLKFLFPIDHVVAVKPEANAVVQQIGEGQAIPADKMALDIGPKNHRVILRGDRHGSHDRLERTDGRFRDSWILQGHIQDCSRGGRQPRCDVNCRRWGFGSGGEGGERRGQDHTHIHGRRCISGIPGRTEVAGSRGFDGKELTRDYIRSSVKLSGVPPKYFCKAFSNIRSSGEIWEKRVIDDLNFISSGDPKISAIDRPSTRRTKVVHSFKRGPRIGCFRYATASWREEIAYSIETGLLPNPLICGKMNHIQWLSFVPAFSSERTR